MATGTLYSVQSPRVRESTLPLSTLPFDHREKVPWIEPGDFIPESCAKSVSSNSSEPPVSIEKNVTSALLSTRTFTTGNGSLLTNGKVWNFRGHAVDRASVP